MINYVNTHVLNLEENLQFDYSCRSNLKETHFSLVDDRTQKARFFFESQSWFQMTTFQNIHFNLPYTLSHCNNGIMTADITIPVVENRR